MKQPKPIGLLMSCKRCGQIYPSRYFRFGGSCLNAHNNQEICRCGGIAVNIPGIYQWQADLHKYLFNASDEQGAKLLASLHALTGDATHETLAKQIEGVWPALAQFIRDNASKITFTLLLAVLSWYFGPLRADQNARDANAINAQNAESQRRLAVAAERNAAVAEENAEVAKREVSLKEFEATLKAREVALKEREFEHRLQAEQEASDEAAEARDAQRCEAADQAKQHSPH